MCALCPLASSSLGVWFDWTVCECSLIGSSLEQRHTLQICSEALWTLSLRSGQDVILETMVSPAVMKESTPAIRSHI